MDRTQNIVGDIYETEVLDMVPQTPRSAYSPRTQRRASQIMEEAYLAFGYDRCRAVLHRYALENIGALSMTAEQLSQLTPQAAEHYWRIVESYTNQATKDLERW